MPDCILRTSRSCFSKAFIGSPILTTCAAARCAGAGRCRACRRGGALWGRVAMSYSCTQQTNKQHGTGRALQIQVPIGRQATGGVAAPLWCATTLSLAPPPRRAAVAPHLPRRAWWWRFCHLVAAAAAVTCQPLGFTRATLGRWMAANNPRRMKRLQLPKNQKPRSDGAEG